MIEKSYFDIENPVVRDELWDDDYDSDEYESDAEYFYYNGRWNRGEADYDKMRGGHDDFESDYY